MTIHERLRLLRKDLGLTQSKSATKFRIPLATWKKYEAGPSEPGSNALKGLALAGVNTNWLLTGLGAMLVPNSQLESTGTDAVNIKRLKLAIETVEEILQESDLEMEPNKKAQAISMTYDILEDEEINQSLKQTKKILTTIFKASA